MITIIVMLILVAVTISVALNGGIFDRAKNASDKTQREVEREELIATMLGGYNSRGNFVIADVANKLLEAKWCTKVDTVYSETTPIDPTPGEGESFTGCWIITKNNNKFYIDKDGTVLDEKPKATLIYNTAYRNVTHYDNLMGERDVTYDFYFFKNYNHCLIFAYTVGDSFSLPMLRQYTYNATTSEIEMNMGNYGVITATLAEDATSFLANKMIFDEAESEQEANLTSEKFEYEGYKSKLDTPDLYAGFYYSESANDIIWILDNKTSAIYMVNNNMSSTGYSSLESALNNIGVTIEDNKTLLYENNEYSLIENL